MFRLRDFRSGISVCSIETIEKNYTGAFHFAFCGNFHFVIRPFLFSLRVSSFQLSIKTNFTWTLTIHFIHPFVFLLCFNLLYFLCVSLDFSWKCNKEDKLKWCARMKRMLELQCAICIKDTMKKLSYLPFHQLSSSHAHYPSPNIHQYLKKKFLYNWSTKKKKVKNRNDF